MPYTWQLAVVLQTTGHVVGPACTRGPTAGPRWGLCWATGSQGPRDSAWGLPWAGCWHRW